MKCQTCKGPREGVSARICTGCEQWLWKVLIDLEGMYGALRTVTALQPVFVPQDPDPTQPRVKNAIPVRSSRPESRSPARDDAIVLTDIRSRTEKGRPASIPGAIRAWSARLADVTVERHAGNVPGWSDHIRRLWDDSCASAWIAEVFKDLRTVHRRAEVLLEEAESEAKPVGSCWQDACEGKLFLEGHLVICGRCGVFTDGFELVQRYEPEEEPESPMMTTAELADHFSARPGTIRVWMHRAGVDRDPEGRVDVRRITEWLASRAVPGVA